jgi:hypothetical protein
VVIIIPAALYIQAYNKHMSFLEKMEHSKLLKLSKVMLVLGVLILIFEEVVVIISKFEKYNMET